MFGKRFVGGPFEVSFSPVSGFKLPCSNMVPTFHKLDTLNLQLSLSARFNRVGEKARRVRKNFCCA
jgi:hypothetical protein